MLSRVSWRKAISVHAIPFAAGVMLSVSLLDVLPEAIEESNAGFVLKVVLLVMVVAFFFEQFFMHLPEAIHTRSNFCLMEISLAPQVQAIILQFSEQIQ